MTRMGLLVLAYGSPDTPDEIEPYYRDIRGGSPPPKALLDELIQRYEAIGGRSPLTDITKAQAEAMARAAARLTGREIVPYVGMKHWRPRISEAVARMAADGIRQAVAIVMAPQYSRASVGEYAQRIDAARVETPGAPTVDLVPSWHDEPGFLDALAERVRAARARLRRTAGEPMHVFTAHSLPLPALSAKDPYAKQLEEMARAVAARAGIAPSDWTTAYQSAGRREVPWLGPPLGDVIEAEAKRGRQAFVVCPAGFVADHLEVLYDLDVECAALAERLGVAFTRTDSLNDDPDFVGALARVIARRLDTFAKA